MIYLLLAIVSSTLVSVCMRFSEKHIKNNMAMFMANYAVCIALAKYFMGNISLFVMEEGIGLAVGLGILCGIFYLVNFVMMQSCMIHNGVTLTSAFMKLGVLVPTLSAIIVFRERPGFLQILGLVLALIGILMIYIDKESARGGGKKSFLILLLVVSGFTDSLANVYDKTGNAALKDHYLFYIFVAAFLLALFMGIRKKEPIGVKDILFGVLIGIPNYFSARFLLLALGSVPAVVAYPMCNVGTIVAISLAGAFLFRERIGKKKLAALALVVLALVLLNM